MRQSVSVALLGVVLGGVLGAVVVREAWPKTEKEVVTVTKHVTIDLSDSTRAALRDSLGDEYDAQAAAAERMLGRLRDRVAELEARPPIVTVDTTIIERPVQVACQADSLAPRWRIAELIVGQDVGAETIVRSEEISADSGSVVFRPRVEHHVTPGPLLGAYPAEDGVQLRFGRPPPEPCLFWCRMGLRGEGAAIGGLLVSLLFIAR